MQKYETFAIIAIMRILIVWMIKSLVNSFLKVLVKCIYITSVLLL